LEVPLAVFRGVVMEPLAELDCVVELVHDAVFLLELLSELYIVSVAFVNPKHLPEDIWRLDFVVVDKVPRQDLCNKVRTVNSEDTTLQSRNL